MGSPFPGMDPYLEAHWLWRDVHLELIHAIRATLAPQVAPRYYVAVEERTYVVLEEGDDLFPDVSVVEESEVLSSRRTRELVASYPAPLTIQLPRTERIRERYLEVRQVSTHEVITVIEILSPTNKKPGVGRKEYEEKRQRVLSTRTNLVEIDLLRKGKPMALGKHPAHHYRILVSRAWERPDAKLYTFDLNQPIPEIPIPLRRDETEPTVKLNQIVHQVYETARYDLRIDYAHPPDPPLEGEWQAWAQAILDTPKTNP